MREMTRNRPVTTNNGHNHTRFNKHNSQKSLNNQEGMAEMLRTSMIANGYVPPTSIIADGVIHRFGKDKRYWYVCTDSFGKAGDWTGKLPPVKCSVDTIHFTLQQRKEHEVKMAMAIKEAERQRLAVQEQTAKEAQKGFDTYQKIGNSGYLAKKQVSANGIRYGHDVKWGCFIAIPLRDMDGKLWTLQRIYDDGRKWFLPNGRKRGCFHQIGTISAEAPIIFCEGYATGSSLYLATNLSVVVCIDAGNLEPVIEAFRKKYPESSFIIAADNDCWQSKNGHNQNIGLQKSEEAANRYSCKVALPNFRDKSTSPTDFNDLHVLEGIGSVREQLKQVMPTNLSEQVVTEEWPEPLPIINKLSPVPPFPVELIPEALKDWVIDIAYRMQCPLDHIAVPKMVMLSSVIGTRCGICPKQQDDWLVIPNLWGGIVAPPSMKKTPALNAVMQPLQNLENKARLEYTQKKAEQELNAEAIKIKKAQMKGKHIEKDFEDIRAQLKELSLLEEEPVCKRLIVNDPTIEKMGELLEQNPRGLLLFRDELMGLLCSWDKEGHESDRAFYLEAWNGYGCFTTDRIGRGTVHCTNMCVSILGGTQPSKIGAYIDKAINNIENDGLLQRLQLLVYPDSLKDWELVDQKPDLIARQKVFSLLEQIDALDFKQYGAIEIEGTATPFFQFDEEAQQYFYNWLTDLELNKLRAEEHPIIIEHLSKYRSLMPSLALIFHILDVVSNNAKGPISLECAERAAAWCDYLEEHARRIYGMGLHKNQRAAAALAKKIKAGALEDSFTARDVQNKDWGLLNTRELAYTACEELVNLNWLRESMVSPAQGQKGTTRYSINPKVREK